MHESTHASYYGVMIWIVMLLENWLTAHEREYASDGSRAVLM